MKSTFKLVAAGILTAFTTLTVVGLIKKPGSVYRDAPSEQNPFEGKRVRFVEAPTDPMNADGVRGHLEELTPDTSAAFTAFSAFTAFTSSEAMMNGGKNGESSKNEKNRENSRRRGSFYERYIKRGLDIILSFCGLVVLSPVYAVISLAIVLDDPGPVLFVQKRVGVNKRYFKLHKFRSMKMSTPHDVPTHQLDHPEQWITSVGRVLRRTSLDELPQIWDIWLGNMSVIGPRPALWNQDVLVALRDGSDVSSVSADDGIDGTSGIDSTSGIDGIDRVNSIDGINGVDRAGGKNGQHRKNRKNRQNRKIGVQGTDVDANSVKPGLTGLAQIKGRDELELEEKARLDREYAEALRSGRGLKMDIKCFFGTIRSVLKHDGVVEGGTGSMK